MTTIALCGGVYSNPYALRAFLDDARARGADRLVCLGDFGAYGAEPEAVFGLLDEVECLAGNYEVAIGSGRTDCGCGYTDDADNAFAQIAYDYTFANTSPAFAAFMRTLPTEHRETVDGVDLHLVHGSTLAVNDFWWESLDDDGHRMRVDASGADVVCCTHSGLPWTRRVPRSDGGETLVVNVGVIGRPANDGDTGVWYALLHCDDGAARAELVALPYDHAAQAASIRAAGLPEAFAATVETGWWETCLEIVPPVERSRGRFQLYKSAIPAFDAGPSWGEAPSVPDDDRPVMPLFGSALFPSRLWVYTNFHCNLACSYCSVASSPQAAPRRLGPERFAALVDEAVREGFTELYVTGGEPFLEPDLADMLLTATEHLDVVCLTNAMLYRGTRRRELERLAGAERLTLQTSLDGPDPGAHDRWRGAGSWARAMAGLDLAVSLGLPVRVGMTETPDNVGSGEALRTLLAEHGVPGDRVAVRPLIARGHSDEGLVVGEDDTVPELTVTADGWHWHPAGADLPTSPDMHLGGPEVSMAEAKRRVVERFLTHRRADGSMPTIYQCAV